MKGFAKTIEEMESRVSNNYCKSKELDEFFASIEEDMFAKNCVAVIGPKLNDFLMNFKSGVGNTIYQKWESLFNQGYNFLHTAIQDEIPQTIIPSGIKRVVKLPFSAYVTTDEFSNLYEALHELGEKAFIVKNEAARNVDIQHGYIPIFQIKRSKIYEDDCKAIEKENETLLKVLLSGRKIIYLGYDKDYLGFIEIGKYLRSILGDDYYTSTKNIALVFDKEQTELIFKDEAKRMTIVNITSEQFLDKMITSNDLLKKMFAINQSENHFVAELFNVASTPTETQAIELLLNQLQEDVEKNIDIKTILNKYDRNVSSLSDLKPNFNAFVKCWNTIKVKLNNNTKISRRQLDEIINDELDKRNLISRKIKNQGGQVLDDNHKNILLFSQSLRVAELLMGATDDFMLKSNIYICECRPKSETPFRDAMDMSERLCYGKGQYKNITIIPDMAAFNMMSRNLIDLVILGAHDVVLHKGKPISFINTCGSSAIMTVAKQNNIPIIVVAEEGKFTEAKYNSEKKQYEYIISYGHESTIYKDFNFALWAKKKNILTKNIGYDYCNFHKGVTLISENKIYNCGSETISVVLIDKTL